MAACYTPFGVRDSKTNETISVPCGKCPACKARRTSAWSFRLMQEDKVSHSSHFVTLTYDTNHVPITGRGFMSVSKRDIQLFMKRLRKLNEQKLKYYLAAEYGGKTMRPHYHIILFNADVATIQSAWQLGQVHYGTVTGASVGYTLKYISKGSKVPLHANDDRVPEFSLMSKGLGKNYLTDSMRRWHKNSMNDRMYIMLPEGKKISMPRYFKDKIYDEDERKVVAFWSRKRMLDRLIERENEMSERDRAEAIRAAFRRSAQKAISNSKI